MGSSARILKASANEEMYRRIVEAVPEGIWVVSPEGRTIFSNQRMAEILRTDVESMQSVSCFDPVFPSDLEAAQRHFAGQLSGQAAPFDFRLRRMDGSAVWVSIACRPVYDDTGVPTGLLGLFTDITRRRHSEAALQESEQRFRNLAETAPMMIWVAGPDKRCTYFNKRCLDFTGHSMEQKIGDGWIACIHPDDREEFLAGYSASFDARQEFQSAFRLRRADGEFRWVLATGAPRVRPDGEFAGYIGSTVDITELRRSQEQALARQKLESVGVLAGGIAHDFNNLLAGILAEAELAVADLEEGQSPLEGIGRIKLAAARSAEIVRELMIYAGQDNGEPFEPVDLSGLVEEMLQLLKVSITKHAVLKADLRPNLPAVLGRASQMRQIVMNLIINGSEAIGETGGVIKVATSSLALPGERPAYGPANLPPGNYMCLEVSDTGVGMTEEMQAKIFDPFFSTKFAGRGLGLAVVQGIVRDHGGSINLASAPGQGANFQVLLPCVDEPARSSGNAVKISRNEFGLRPGVVLVVEDEEMLRRAVSKMLRTNGLGVLETGDGSSALELVRGHKDKIDVMLLDITLPGISSREVLVQAWHTRPDLKVILTSAYSRETVDASFAGLRIDRFIRKPFHLIDLMGLLQDALSA